MDENIYREIQFIQNSIQNIINIFPEIIINQVNYSDVNIPKHWNISHQHGQDIKNIVNKYYSKLGNFYDDDTLTQILKDIQIISKTIKSLSDNTPFYAYLGKDNNERYSVFDRRLTLFLFNFYFLKILDNYILLINKIGILLNPQLTAIIEDDESAEKSLELTGQATHDITATDIDVIDKKLLSKKLANYIITIMKIICGNKKNINYNSEIIAEGVLKSKEKEKEGITDYLKGLTDEERQIENLFKNAKLERWSKGLQKGITQYVQKTYDEEREDLEKQAITEKNLGVKSEVTDMNKNIYALELDTTSRLETEIDADVYALTTYPNEGGDDTEGVDDAEADYENDVGDDIGFIAYEGYEGAD